MMIVMANRKETSSTKQSSFGRTKDADDDYDADADADAGGGGDGDGDEEEEEGEDVDDVDGDVEDDTVLSFSAMDVGWHTSPSQIFLVDSGTHATIVFGSK